MNAVNGIFLALAIVFGGGYALEKIFQGVKVAAVNRLQKGQPSLSRFTNKMTCSRFSKSGNYFQQKCGHDSAEKRK